MNVRKLFTSAVFSAFILLASLPAKAGIPVFDSALLTQQIQQVAAWAQQAQQMTSQYNQMLQQFQQLQSITATVNGIRSLGTILNNPDIVTSLPSDMQDSTQLLVNPSALVTSQSNLSQILSSYGVDTSLVPTAGQSQADTIGRMQQILASAQLRNTQLQQLATRVDGTVDAKDSLDMMNRNVLEVANINNQAMQTQAALEAARQSAELKRIAQSQAFFAAIAAGAAQPLTTP